MLAQTLASLEKLVREWSVLQGEVPAEAAVLEDFGAVLGLQSLTVYGGVPKYTQVAALKQGTIDCLVATPGRLKDLIQERSCNLSAVQHLVLDEADRMLDMGFEEDVRFIISNCSTAGKLRLKQRAASDHCRHCSSELRTGTMPFSAQGISLPGCNPFRTKIWASRGSVDRSLAASANCATKKCRQLLS